MNKTINRLALAVEQEGFQEGTPEFDHALRLKKIEHCQELKGVLSCAACPFCDFCSLVQEHARSLNGG